MTAPRIASQIVTARETPYRLTRLPDITLSEQPRPSVATVTLDPRVTYQTIEGFGAAFTQSAALTYYALPEARRSELLRAYFDPMSGNGYTLCRTHIGSCDFSVGNYSYADQPGDTDLSHFSIEPDRGALLPMIKEALAFAPEPFRLLATPWSPPAWMKTNNEMCHGGSLKPEYRGVYAEYLCRYIREYTAEGISIWGLSIQNEPMALQTWESCLYSPEEARDFIRDYLGPALARNGMDDVCLLIWDHNRDELFDWIKPIYDDPEASRYIWGTAFHWYVADKFDNLQLAHDAYPDKKLLFSEGCMEGGPHLGEWAVGERYGHSILNDLNHWAVGWIDWNLLLDETGGPNHVGNFCSAPIIADRNSKALLYQNAYYYIGHFSRFIKPGAERILCATSHDNLEATAFRNPDGSFAVVVLNRADTSYPFALSINGQLGLTESLPHSITTYCLPAMED